MFEHIFEWLPGVLKTLSLVVRAIPDRNGEREERAFHRRGLPRLRPELPRSRLRHLPCTRSR